MTFVMLGVLPALVGAMQDRGHALPTAVQAATIPAALEGRDVMACAQTGSGKTAAFVLPILQGLQAPVQGAKRRITALVLVPTRELAAQVGQEFSMLARHMATPALVATVFGGVSINTQMMGLRGGADVVVATPGRLLDLIAHNALTLAEVRTLVLDEADRLLDAGFADELQRLLSLLPPRRQVMLFSATFPEPVQALARALLREPVCIDVQQAVPDLSTITQRALQVDAAARTPLLRQLIAKNGGQRVLVFVATQYATEHVAGKLRGQGVVAAALHGQLSQGARQRVLADFKASQIQVLVATDLAARGLHITGLPMVVNYDLPRSAADHVHRIGRTGRAGAAGLAISFISPEFEAHFRLIEKRQCRRVQREQVAGFEPQGGPVQHHAGPAPTVDANGGIKGRRKSKKDKLREAAALRGV